MKQFILFRIFIWRCYFNDTLTFSQALNRMLLNKMRSQKDTQIKLFGHPFVFPLSYLSEVLGMAWDVIEKNHYHSELIPYPINGSVVDAGANIGVFSVLAAQKSTVYAFEPDPEMFTCLKENTKYYPNVKVFNCALGETTGTVPLITGTHISAHIGAGGTSVPVNTIDSHNIMMDFLKIDTEGFEANILRGAIETIKKWKPIIIMSAYHKPNDKVELPKLLNSIARYDCKLENKGEQIFICKPI